MKNEESAEKINAVQDLLTECMDLNNVPIHIGGQACLHLVLEAMLKLNISVDVVKELFDDAFEMYKKIKKENEVK